MLYGKVVNFCFVSGALRDRLYCPSVCINTVCFAVLVQLCSCFVVLQYCVFVCQILSLNNNFLLNRTQ